MKTYPYVCDKCGYFQWDRKSVCESCGNINTIRKTTKRDWKKFYLHQNIEKYTA